MEFRPFGPLERKTPHAIERHWLRDEMLPIRYVGICNFRRCAPHQPTPALDGMLRESQGFIQMNYSITLVESEEGFAVWCDELPGCASQGQTREEALENIREAVREYLDAIPEVQRRFKTRVYREEISV